MLTNKDLNHKVQIETKNKNSQQQLKMMKEILIMRHIYRLPITLNKGK